jgi:hypothetical protein
MAEKESAAKPGEKSAERREAAERAGGDLAALNGAGIEAAFEAGEAMLRGAGSLSEELTRFASQRLQADLETGRSIMQSGNDWSQAFSVQSSFASEAMRDYLEEMTKITSLASRTTQEVWSPLQRFSTRLANGELGRPS